MTEKLLTVDEFIERNFETASAPPKETVWRWIREGNIPAVKMGRRYYIPNNYAPASVETIFREVSYNKVEK